MYLRLFEVLLQCVSRCSGHWNPLSVLQVPNSTAQLCWRDAVREWVASKGPGYRLEFPGSGYAVEKKVCPEASR